MPDKPNQRLRALRPIEYPTAPSVISAIRSGQNPPMHLRGHVRIEAGEWADEWARLMPASSIALYVRKGWVEAVEVESDPVAAVEGGE